MTKRCVGMAMLGLVIAVGRAGAADPPRVAVVDTARALKAYHKTEQAEEQMAEQVAELKAERERMTDEYAQKQKAFEDARREAQDPALSKAAQEEKKDLAELKLLEMAEFESEVRQRMLSHRRQIDEQRVRMHRRLTEEISRFIADYAARQGYTLVLDAGGATSSGFKSVIYSGDSLDITEAVIGGLNQDQGGVE